MENQSAERTEDFFVDLPKIINAVWHKIWVVMLVALLAAALCVGMAAHSFSPTYRTSAIFYAVDNNLPAAEAIQQTPYNAEELAQFYIVVLYTQDVLEKIIDCAGTEQTVRELTRMVTAEPIDETSMFRVSVTGEDPALLDRLLNAIITVLPADDTSELADFSCQAVYSDMEPSEINSPGYVKNAITGFLAGFVLSVGMIVLWVVFDKVIRTKKDLARCCQYPVLTEIPVMTANAHCMPKNKAGSGGCEPVGAEIGFAATEAYKLLRTKLQFSADGENASHVIGISSALNGEGKSLTAINLAYVLSQLDKKVALIDCDMRCSAMPEKISLSKEMGLSDYLTGQCPLEDALQDSGIHGTEKNLHVVSAGSNPSNPLELLNSTRMQKALQTLREQYDYVILNLPALCEVSDAMVVSKMTDGVLLVVRQDYSNRTALLSAVCQLESIHAKILGIVLNGTKNQGRKWSKRPDKKYCNAYMKSGESEKLAQKTNQKMN